MPRVMRLFGAALLLATTLATPHAATAHAQTRAAPARPNAGACATEDDDHVFRIPRAPFVGGEARLVWVGDEARGPARAVAIAPDGTRTALELVARGGPPHALVAAYRPRAAGVHSVVFEDADGMFACEVVEVGASRAPAARPVTSARNAWSRGYENLYSVFVEQLFDVPPDDRTWPGLDPLLRDPARNLLHDHFNVDEEQRLSLAPDCADLPFTLRAYFAWKMGLPFAVRSCSRGREGAPPSCGEPVTNVDWPDATGEPVRDFQRFVTSVVANLVHSASTRTAPTDDATDLYPVPLTRDALRPGTVFADPYGHVMMIVRYVRGPTASESYLLAADAQPDGTIGRPRFWQGTFLFTRDTRSVGAGFKAFRPLVRRGSTVRARPNRELRTNAFHAPHSLEQYEHAEREFYHRVERAIDARPVDAATRLDTLLDALLASAVRRTVSVANAEAFVASHPRTISMPADAEIFQTSGPWEDFSTPSRDLRLLIALDVVLAFPDVVFEHPDGFGIPATEASGVRDSLRLRLEEGLRARTFDYRASDGRAVTLSLAELRDRRSALELAYNPNDCPEVRWGAATGSGEMRACARRAPSEQQRRMDRIRVWFRDRRRPPR